MAEVTLGDDVEGGGVVENVIVEGEVTTIGNDDMQQVIMTKSAQVQNKALYENLPGNEVDSARLEVCPVELFDL